MGGVEQKDEMTFSAFENSEITASFSGKCKTTVGLY